MTANARTVAGGILILAGFLSGCNRGEARAPEGSMGEKVRLGPLTYSVIDSTWRSHLGDALKVRTPEQRYLVLTLSVTNGGGSDVSIPLLNLENPDGKDFLESDNGDGVENWMGLLRTLSPAQTLEGKLLFDVPLTSYRLRLTDGAGPGIEKYGWVSIPLRLDVDTDVPTPLPEPPK